MGSKLPSPWASLFVLAFCALFFLMADDVKQYLDSLWPF